MDLNQITLNIIDFREAVDFYESLGFRLIVSAREEYARFELPSGSSTLSLHLSPSAPTSDTLIYFEVDDVDHQYGQLKSRGIVFEGAPVDQPWRWREVRFRDPSGNRLCLYHAGPDRRFPPWRLTEK